MDFESFRASLGQRWCTIMKHFWTISTALYPLHPEKPVWWHWIRFKRLAGATEVSWPFSLELSFLGSLGYFSSYGSRNTQLSAIVGPSVTHISSSRPIYSPAHTQTQPKRPLGCLWPGDLCSQSEWEWGTAHYSPKPGHLHELNNNMMWLSEKQTFRSVV